YGICSAPGLMRALRKTRNPFSVNAFAAAGALAALADTGHLGRKSGQGFYRWEAGKAQKAAAGPLPEGLAERIVAPLVAATRRCVEQGVVA
ncbi:MAG TPA: hypothetical protein PL143_13485, partial [Rhodocyclaceae bacterium]|nr:hypothetical protein [Rhodocyclaceae bacterium]